MAYISRFGNMVYTAYLNSHLLSEMKWKARRMGVSVNRLMNEAMREYLTNHPRQSEDAEKITIGGGAD